MVAEHSCFDHWGNLQRRLAGDRVAQLDPTGTTAPKIENFFAPRGRFVLTIVDGAQISPLEEGAARRIA
jgi:hypothetical protein